LRDNGLAQKLAPPLPPGPYAVFYHISFAQERIGDVRFIFERMVQDRRELGELLRRELSLRPLDPPEPPRSPQQEEDLRAIWKRQTYLTRSLRLDFEALYAFGAIFLDQWSMMAAYLTGMDKPEDVTFHQLSIRLESSKDLPQPLKNMANSLLANVRWLQLQLRTLRNRFVEHVDRPWQRGTTMGVHGMEFTLFIPSPPGWLNDEEVGREIYDLLKIAPKWLQDAPGADWKARPRALLEGLVEHVGSIDSQADRDRIAKLVGLAGLTTPSFQVLAGRLADFAIRGTRILMDAVLADPSMIVLEHR
jgi:hypothetical protein